MKEFKKVLKVLSILMVVGLMLLPADFAFASGTDRPLTDRENAAFIVRDEWTAWVKGFTASLSELDKNATSRIYDNMDFYDMQYRFTEKYKKVPEYLDEDGKPTQKLKDLIKQKRKEINGAQVRDYLCFTSKENGSTVAYTLTGLSASSIDIGISYDGTSFAPWNGSAVTLDSGKSVWIRNKADRLSQGNNDNYFKFVLTGNIEASGNVESMINFKPVSSSCFARMFYGQTALKVAPEMPSSAQANYCCASMFEGCTGLTEAPELPATSLASYCYYRTFYGCSNITTGPSILPAARLAGNCYEEMFVNCSGLVEAPILPATTLDTACYSSMFKGCGSLNSITIDYPFTSMTQMNSYCSSWVDGVSDTGTFYCNISVSPSNYSYGPHQIPKLDNAGQRWNVVNRGLDYMTFTSTRDGSIVSYSKTGGLVVNNFYYSRDKVNWINWNGEAVTLNNGEKLYMWNKNNTLSTNVDSEYLRFNIPASSEINVSGNVNSMLNFGEVTGQCFGKMFYGCTGLRSVSNFKLPSNNLTGLCYAHMFHGCNNLEDAPELPATTLSDGCYMGMFTDCKKLTVAPALPATNSADRCYCRMYEGCDNLKRAPATIPLTNARWCSMYKMFYNCRNLENAPEILVTSLSSTSCLSEMFYGCSKINRIKIAYTGAFTAQFTNWVSGVADSGTFYYNGSDTSNFGPSAIPKDSTHHWTVQTY